MRILHRQILKEVFSHGLLGLVLFTFVLFLRDTTNLLALLLRESALWGQVAHLTLLAFPPLLTFTIPMAVVVGILIGLSRMASDGEVTALRACGMSGRTFLLPLGLVIGLGCSIGVFLSAYMAPYANQKRMEIERQIGLRQIPTELQPRVFEERFPNLVFYVREVTNGTNLDWKGIFVADISSPTGPKVTLAQEGLLLSDPSQNQLQLHLVQGSSHETGQQPNEYSIATFSETDIPIRLPPPPPPSVKPISRRPTAELYRVPQSSPEGLDARLEFHRRLALPFATLFLSLVGIPFSLAPRKGGKSTGVVLTLFMVLVYYSLFIGGISLARQHWLPPWLGVWGADLLFGLAGVFLLARLDRITPAFGWLASLAERSRALQRWFSSRRSREEGLSTIIQQQPALWAAPNFPRILDRYIAKSFLFYLTVILAALILLTDIVTFFLDLLNDVIRNQIPAVLVLDYFVSLTPYLLYITAPLAVLIAVLVSFGILNQSNEITAVKASGISLFRLTLPIFLLSTLLSAALFLFDHLYIPAANRHQDAIRNRIKGRPAQTYYRPDRKWIMGEDPRIYYYNFFEPTEQVLGGITVFELDPETFQLTRRISAQRAHWEPSLQGWVFQEGWVRKLHKNSVQEFQQFQVQVFPELREPPSYFLKEVKQSSQMNFLELRRYLQDLQQSGFDVTPLSVQFHKKFSFPVFVLIMTLIGLSFAFSLGKKGALTGIAVSLGIAIVFWGISSLFEVLGNLNELPPLAAAWSPNLLFGLGGLYLFLKIKT
ncbi:MAG: LptF/LptG family permease [Acidobacteria bacterium]|nr:LptF/LptG family permease [Acidobacteriota bacterium]